MFTTYPENRYSMPFKTLNFISKKFIRFHTGTDVWQSHTRFCESLRTTQRLSGSIQNVQRGETNI